MEVHIKSIFVDQWKVVFFLAQCILLAALSIRTKGALIKAALHSEASAFGVKMNRDANQKFNGLSHILMHFFCIANLIFLFSEGLSKTYYLYTASLIAMVLAVSLMVLWFLDGLLLLIASANLNFSAASFRFGNVLWYLFGFFVFACNAMLTFSKGSFTLFGLICLFIFGLFVLVKVLKGVWSALRNGFPWYYLILYFCTVYVVPILFLNEWIGANWLELLTI
jgi:hypothetical protein